MKLEICRRFYFALVIGTVALNLLSCSRQSHPSHSEIDTKPHDSKTRPQSILSENLPRPDSVNSNASALRSNTASKMLPQQTFHFAKNVNDQARVQLEAALTNSDVVPNHSTIREYDSFLQFLQAANTSHNEVVGKLLTNNPPVREWNGLLSATYGEGDASYLYTFATTNGVFQMVTKTHGQPSVLDFRLRYHTNGMLMTFSREDKTFESIEFFASGLVKSYARILPDGTEYNIFWDQSGHLSNQIARKPK